MRAVALAIPEVLRIEPQVFTDPRGEFMETWRANQYAAAGIPDAFVQDNQSRSARWVLRGMHSQVRQMQGKLVRVITGEIFDVAIDMRRASPTFGRWVGARLSAENRHALWIPPGFAHGFLSLADDTRVAYKVTDYWAAEWDRTLAWNDPQVGIEWPLPAGTQPMMSDKDAQGSLLSAAELPP